MSNPDFTHYLTTDHRHCDECLGLLRSQAIAGHWAAAAEAFARADHDIRAHFAAEEEVLFPAFEASSGMTCGPTAVMRMEHEEARELLLDLSEAIAAQDAEGVRGYGEALLILLQQHNMKEENILYPMAKQGLGPQASEVATQIMQRREAA